MTYSYANIYERNQPHFLHSTRCFTNIKNLNRKSHFHKSDLLYLCCCCRCRCSSHTKATGVKMHDCKRRFPYLSVQKIAFTRCHTTNNNTDAHTRTEADIAQPNNTFKLAPNVLIMRNMRPSVLVGPALFCHPPHSTERRQIQKSVFHRIEPMPVTTDDAYVRRTTQSTHHLLFIIECLIILFTPNEIKLNDLVTFKIHAVVHHTQYASHLSGDA